MASEQRIRDEARIRRATRALIVGSLGATAAFAGLAATATHHDGNATSVQTQQSTDDSSSSSDSFGAPEQSSSPPVAQSGGS